MWISRKKWAQLSLQLKEMQTEIGYLRREISIGLADNGRLIQSAGLYSDVRVNEAIVGIANHLGLTWEPQRHMPGKFTGGGNANR